MTREVKDIYSASYVLATCGGLLKAAPDETTGFVVFVFDDAHGQATRAEREYWQKRGLVNAYAFVRSFRRLQSVVKDEFGRR